jgi:hypothetical protein
MRPRTTMIAMTGVAASALLLFGAGAAYAVSGGGYSSPGQDCPWTASNWNTTEYQTTPGCHLAQLSVESGGTTDGNPDNGYNDSKTQGDHGATNTQWAQVGIDQVPVDNSSQATPTFWGIGYPGQAGAPHAGCVAANTDGTGGGPAPAGAKTEAPSKAETQQKYGCGNNAAGTGFDLTYDYYQVYCPLAADLGTSYPYACQSLPGGDAGTSTLTPDTGSKQDVTNIATNGLIVDYNMDDNANDGEHDGEGPTTSPQTQGSANGASDGGGTFAAVTPQGASHTPSLTTPEGLANATVGFCADGNCAAATTDQETAYYGCGANTGEDQAEDKCPKGRADSSRDVYNYSGKQWDPYNCSSGGEQPAAKNDSNEPDSPQACDTSSSNPSPSGASNPSGGENYWRQQEAHKVNTEPGVQEYQDPDAEGSPAAPIYPNPAVYAGTCGVALGGGQLAAPASPYTNPKTGQLIVSTGC